jgi:hypothetical protein
MKKIWNSFWSWYDSHPTLTLGVTLGLFGLQIIHLIWLLTNVIWTKAFGHALFAPGEVFERILILVDYTEIPALIAASLVYIDDLRKEFSFKAILYLIFLNTQWLHLFWITDEFVVSEFTQNILIPSWLAWIAILIDYLEVPIIYDTLKKFIVSLHKGEVREAFNAISERD